MKGLKIFVTITIASLVIIIAAFIFLYFEWIGRDNNPLSNPDKVQALTSILALVAGTAAALGSAIAALKIASLGLEISHQQERRDNVEFVDSKIAVCIDTFSEIALTLGEIHSSAVAVNAKIPHIAKDKTLAMMKEEPATELEVEMQQLADNLLALSDLLKKIMKNDLAKSCYYEALKGAKVKSPMLNQRLKEIDPDESKHSVYDINLGNLSDISSILDLAQRRIRRGRMGELIEARLYTNSSDIDLFSMPYDNANVRTFFFLGNLVLSIAYMQGPIFIANYGAAMLHDIFYCIPDGTIIESVLDRRYSNLFRTNQSYKVDFDPKQITSKYFQNALSDAEAIGDLYLLIGKSEE